VRIYKTYGADAVQLISENPYRLARDIRGIGFRTADQIAGKLGIEKTALIRVRAGIAYALTEPMDEGNSGLPAEELISLTQTLLEVPVELVETALGLELEGGAVIADDLEDRRCVFLAASTGLSGRLRKNSRRWRSEDRRGRRSTPPKRSLGWSSARSWCSPTANERLFASLSFPRCW